MVLLPTLLLPMKLLLLLLLLLAACAGTGMSPELKRSVDEFIAANRVVVFMKGNKEAPQVGGQWTDRASQGNAA